MKRIFPNTLSTFEGSAEIAERNGYVAISDEEYEALVNGSAEWSDGKIVAAEPSEESAEAREKKKSRLAEIAACRSELRLLDIKTMKYVDGNLTAVEYEPYRRRKQELRDRINELE